MVKGMGRVPVTTIPTIDILLVCTGNMCRSPMAEAMLRHQLDERGVEVDVHSAGLTGDGSPASEPAVQVMAAEYELPIDAHRSRLLTADLIERQRPRDRPWRASTCARSR